MDRQVFARLVPLLLITASLSGCAPGAQDGRVVVEVRAMAPGSEGDSYEVSVLDSDGQLVSSREVVQGSSTTFDKVPLGWVSVEATSSCAVESELTAQHPTLTFIVDAENCTITD